MVNVLCLLAIFQFSKVYFLTASKLIGLIIDECSTCGSTAILVVCLLLVLWLGDTIDCPE